MTIVIEVCSTKGMPNLHPIRIARKAANMTQRELALRVGVHHSAISLYESWQCRPDPDVALRMVQLLKLDFAEIYTKAA